MGYANWPIAADVLLVCEGFGVESFPVGFDVAVEVGAWVAEIERRAGVSPILAGSGFLTLEMLRQAGATGAFCFSRPLVEIESVSIDGQELEKGVGWDLYDSNSPWRELRLNFFGGDRVSVRGRVGLFDSVPADMWRAVRDLVAVRALDQVWTMASGSEISEIRQDSVSVKYREMRGSGAVESLRESSLMVLDRWSGFGLGASS